MTSGPTNISPPLFACKRYRGVTDTIYNLGMKYCLGSVRLIRYNMNPLCYWTCNVNAAPATRNYSKATYPRDGLFFQMIDGGISMRGNRRFTVAHVATGSLSERRENVKVTWLLSPLDKTGKRGISSNPHTWTVLHHTLLRECMRCRKRSPSGSAYDIRRRRNDRTS